MSQSDADAEPLSESHEQQEHESTCFLTWVL